MPDRRRQAVRRLTLVVFTFLFATSASAATGRHGAVAAEHRLASDAGIEILRAGGNAIDAAVAAMLVSGVVNPASSGIGGGGFMVIFDAEESRAHAVDFRETAPASARADMYVHDGTVDTAASKRGGTAVATPGEVAGLTLILQRFGTKGFADVAAPAIRLARDGFVVEEHLASLIAAFKEPIAADPGLSSVFLHPDGSPYKAGELLRRPDLARTLEALAAKGSGAFYDGDIAADIVQTVARAGGSLTGRDLASYRPVLRAPVMVTFDNDRILGMPPPSSGGGIIAEALQVLAPFRPTDLGQNSPTYLHVLTETLKGTFADRALWYGDPDQVNVPLERLLAPAHAARIRSHISATRATPAAVYGQEAAALDAGTAHVSVVDEHGNAAACTSSVNTPFGALLSVPGRDIILNDTMDDFTAQPGVPNAYGLVGTTANAIAPGKRPLSSMSPTIVLHGSSVRLVLGASGGPRIISATLQVLLDVLAFSMDVDQAVAAPRIHHQWKPDVLFVEGTLPAATRESLARRGHEIAPLEHGAAVQAVEVVRDAQGRLLRAASDLRKGGVAAAY